MQLQRLLSPCFLARHSTSGSFPLCRVQLVRTLTTGASVGDNQATDTKRAEVSLKRFWKTVEVDKRNNKLIVTLDKRPLRTPSGNILLLPESKALLATLIAAEWENQRTVLKPHALPMTSLASRAIDACSSENMRSEIRSSLLQYLDTDTICFHQEKPQSLGTLQREHWHPVLNWARSRFGVEITTFDSILFESQPDHTKAKFAEILSEFDLWEMAAMERATYSSKSFLISLALVKRFLTAEKAALAAQVEVSSQTQRWGEVEDSHDVDFHDIRRQLSSVACLLSNI